MKQLAHHSGKNRLKSSHLYLSATQRSSHCSCCHLPLSSNGLPQLLH